MADHSKRERRRDEAADRPERKPAAAESSPKDSGIGRYVNLFLGMIVILLGFYIVTEMRPPARVTIGSNIPVPSKSESVQFQREIVPDTTLSRAQICNVQVVDLDGDSKQELLVCDAARNAILRYDRTGNDDWQETVLANGLMIPAHATVVDIDQDGRKDILVASLGDLWPSDELIGKLFVLHNTSEGYVPILLLDDVRRVADAQPGDFDGDGDVDIAVAVFGYVRGELLWLENRGDWKFRDHHLLDRPGIVHVPVGDMDGDGDPDINAIATQHNEELWSFENLGDGAFKPRQLHFWHNFDLGGAGLMMNDLDQDGDLDLILPQGDNLELTYGWPQPYHGCVWAENKGGWQFEVHPITKFGSTYAADTGDFDGDGDKDLVLVSMSKVDNDPANPSVVWLENDGHQNFSQWFVDSRPRELITVACGDLDGDGVPDIVAGGMDVPSTGSKDTQRLSVWTTREPAR